MKTSNTCERRKISFPFNCNKKILFQKQPSVVSYNKVFLKNVAKFTGKRQTLFDKLHFKKE